MRRASIITAVVMALVTTACGGESEVATTEVAAASTAGPAETTTTTAAPAETTTLTAAPTPFVVSDGTMNVTLVDFEISPVLAVVRSGEPIVVNLENRASENHSWALLTAGTRWTTWQDFDLEEIIAATQGIQEDGTATLEFIAPEPGTYQVVCTVRGHIQRGMVAELVVEE